MFDNKNILGWVLACSAVALNLLSIVLVGPNFGNGLGLGLGIAAVLFTLFAHVLRRDLQAILDAYDE